MGDKHTEWELIVEQEHVWVGDKEEMIAKTALRELGPMELEVPQKNTEMKTFSETAK